LLPKAYLNFLRKKSNKIKQNKINNFMAKINKDKCLGCAICTNICPEGIEIVDGKAEIKDENASCLKEAARACPQNAIDVGDVGRESNENDKNYGTGEGAGMGPGTGRGMGAGGGRGLGRGPRDGRGQGKGGGGRRR